MKNDNQIGYWPSPISADMLASKSTRLGQMQIIGEHLYWLESRPHDNGRGVIVSHQNGNNIDITPEPYNVRTRVHEYAGGDFWGRDELLIFADDSDQQLMLQDLKNHTVKELTAKPHSKRSIRYCDGDINSTKQFTVCVREQHQDHSVINDLVSISLDSGEVMVLAQGHDFYSNPRLSPDGKKITWLAWSHPNMPWDYTELWVADIDEFGKASNIRQLVTDQQASFYNPQWSEANELFFVADFNHWWHIYKFDSALITHAPVHEFVEIEFGLPQWVFGCNTYQVLPDLSIVAMGTKQGKQSLYKIEDHKITPLEQRYSAYSGQMVSYYDNLYFIAASEDEGQSVRCLNLHSKQLDNYLDSESPLSQQWISIGQHKTFLTSGGDKAYGYFYPPKNPQQLSHGVPERPALIVMSHGGPTGMTDSGLDLAIQYWTSRGFAVADVNYRGSTGYGRVYREKLKGQWGVYDVDDCIAMAQYLANEGLVDGDKMAIRGGSAGGLTTLCALTFHNVFKAGMSRYGVADLENLASDCHKFEERYLDSMIGPLPEAIEIYKQRSPIEHTDKLSCPILILQGLDDKVVPPSQAEAMVAALKAKNLPYEYITFEGEGHGFRKPETIIKAFEAELEFYRKYLL